MLIALIERSLIDCFGHSQNYEETTEIIGISLRAIVDRWALSERSSSES